MGMQPEEGTPLDSEVTVHEAVRHSISERIREQDNDWSRYEPLWKQYSADPIYGDVTSVPDRSQASPTKSVSVIIPAFQAGATISACLAAIERSTLHRVAPHLLQVIIVDDGSTDQTWEILASYTGSLQLLALRQQWCGQTPALNTGLAFAQGEIIVLCDADMLLNVWALEELVLRHQVLDNVVCVGFRGDIQSESVVCSLHEYDDALLRQHVFFLDNRFQFEDPGWPENMFVETKGFRELGYARKLWMSCDEFWDLPRMVYGCLFSIAASDLHLIGGFDEQLKGWGFSDTLIGAKAKALGRLIVPVITANGWHVGHPYRMKTQPQEAVENARRYNEILENRLRIPLGLPAGAKQRALTWRDWAGTSSAGDNGYRPSLTRATNEGSARVQAALGHYIPAAENWGTCEPSVQVIAEQAKNLRFGGMPEAAEELLARFSVIYHSAELTIQRAFSLASMGRFTAAQAEFEKPNNLDPHNQLCRYINDTSLARHLARAQFYKLQGNFNLSRRDCEAVLMREPTHREALSIISTL